MTEQVVIIGGGPAGLMAAIAASSQGVRTLLIDKGSKPGRKLGISGGGRCNVTNAGDMDEIIRHIPGNGRFLYSAFSRFGNRDIISFFEGLGIRLKEEDRGRMFPISDKAKTVVDALVNQVRAQGVTIRLDSPVERVLYENGHTTGVLLKSGETIPAQAVIIATGGKSVPHTGSTGDGYGFAEDAGHSITSLYPTEVPLTSEEPFIKSKELQGLALKAVAITVWNHKNKAIVTHEGDMLFTHFGLSGPVILRCSQFVVKALKQSALPTVRLTIDLLPDKSKETVYQEIMRLAEEEPKKAIKNVLKGYLPERLIPLLLNKADLSETLTYANLPKQGIIELSRICKLFPVDVTGTLSLEEAFVTGGGVNLKEIDPKTMGSKLMTGLYFCGEVLDVHGYTGGYNITAAFSSGYTAGYSAAEQIRTQA